MIFIFRATFYFTLSFLILSIPINNKAIFIHLNQHTSPLFKGITSDIESGFQKGVNRTKNFTKKLFSNSSPQLSPNKVKDQVTSKMSSWIKYSGLYKSGPEEKVTPSKQHKKNTKISTENMQHEELDEVGLKNLLN